MYIKKEVKNIEISDIRKIAEKMKKYNNHINLTIGEPDLEINNIIKESMAYHALNSPIKYSPVGGLPELKNKIAKYYNENFKSEYTENNVIITVGSTEGLASTLRTILKEGDEVLIPTPAYVGYEPLISLSGGITKFIDLKNNNFLLTGKDIEKNITNKTRAIILTSPNNPTGMVINPEEMEKIVEIISNNEIYLISDEIYAALSFENYTSFGKYFNKIREKLIVVSGFSKSHSMTGYRIGYLLLDESLEKEIKKVSQYSVASPCTLSQYGAITALDKCSDTREYIKIYKSRTEYFSNELKKMGFNVLESKGGFYLFAGYENIEKLKDTNSYDFVVNLLNSTGIGIVPGSSFKVEKYVRFSLVCDIEILEIASKKIKYFIDNL